ncbi:MAG: 23S rRNA (adenine(2503)-C(2))-methyltransferase RlmN [Treponema sp.]|jgi:23S rRNA (adenine2503-C2)-methyltransferase|nr:23S rRNA (adenine(2503)-C(2))-methyltransferase RlmN [Treponema sp.]
MPTDIPSSLAGLSLCDLETILNPLPRFRARQIYKWILRGAGGFEQMTDIPIYLQKELTARFRIFSSVIVSRHDDADARKIVLALKDGSQIESVLLSDGKRRLTACLSTQAGCPIGCVFCKTGSLGFVRNLDCQEIVEQLIFLSASGIVRPHSPRSDSETSGNIKNKDGHIIDNIVVMGMGEPLLNLTQLRKAIAIFNDPAGMNYSKRRITISTCGICDSLFDVAENGPFVRLALSLITADEELRQKLMPAASANPLQKVREALILFQRNGSGRITLEIPLLGGVNTREKDALSIAEFAAGIDSVVNIIPWNPVAGFEFEGKPLREPEKNETSYFSGKLESLGLKVTTRLRKGRSVMGACGQLGGEI